MNRFKFRVWDTKRNEFAPNSILTVGFHGNLYANSDKETKRGDFVIQQFTGFYDKNKKEIYEGDILANEDGLDFVYFREGCFWVDDQWLYDHASDNEVIGNIFENPKLLK